MPSITTSGTPLQETDWYQSGRHDEWVKQNERIGYAYRFLRAYEGEDSRLLELKHKISRVIARGDKPGKKEEILTIPEAEEAYELSRAYPHVPKPPPEAPKQRGERKIPEPRWGPLANRLREQGLVPISEAHRADLRRKLDQLNVGVHCEFVYITGMTHLTRKGEYVEHDDTHIILLSEGGKFYKVPIENVFHGSYDVKQQGGKIK